MVMVVVLAATQGPPRSLLKHCALQVWECRSRLARSLIARKCAFSFQVGIFAWVKLIIYCLFCCLGHWGCYLTICR